MRGACDVLALRHILLATPLLAAMPQTACADPPIAARRQPATMPIDLVRRSRMRHRDWTRAFEGGDQRFELAGSRTRSQRAMDMFSMVPDDRIAAWSLSGRYDHDIAALGSIGVVGTIVVEKRHPWGLLSRGKSLGSRTMFAGFEWTDGDGARLSLGLFSSAETGRRWGFDRLTELAAGAPLAASGLRLAGDIRSWAPDTADGRGTTLGFDARLQHIAATDVDLLGDRPHGRDGQMMLSVRHRF